VVDLTGKNIIVTGGGRGLGRAYSMAIARAGARVVVNDIDADVAHAVAEEIRDEGNDATADAGSVTDWAYAERLVGNALDRGPLDGIVLNAGVFQIARPDTEDEQRLRRITEVNVLGPLFCGTHALRAMYRQGAGVVVTVTSGALFAALPWMAAYGATKGAIAALTWNWALDSAPHGVRVNGIAPLGDTRMLDVGRTTDWVQRPPVYEEGFPLPQPEDVAPIAVYLLSDQADFTGQIVRFEGWALGLMPRPAYVEEVIRDSWTADEIAAEFDGHLRAGCDVVTGPS